MFLIKYKADQVPALAYMEPGLMQQIHCIY